jgi:hypothetical protein
MRDLAAVLDHEKPLPHPACDHAPLQALHRKTFSTSRTRRLSARPPSTVPRGLVSPIDMIAVNPAASQKQVRREPYCTDNTDQRGVKSRLSGRTAICSRRFLRSTEKPPVQARGFFRQTGLPAKSKTGVFHRRKANRLGELVGILRGGWGGSFVPRHALVSQKALVGLAIHHGTAFLTDRVFSGRFGHGDVVFRSAVAFMSSGEPFYEFGHARTMRPESAGCQPAALHNQTDPLPAISTLERAVLGTMPISSVLQAHGVKLALDTNAHMEETPRYGCLLPKAAHLSCGCR